MSSFLPPKSRLLELTKLRCNIFNENFNPLNIRTGSKILTQRLKGENIKRYYGNPDMIRFKELRSLFPTIDWVDPAEVYRLKINQSYVSFRMKLCVLLLTCPIVVNVEVKVPQRRRRKKEVIKRRRNKGVRVISCCCIDGFVHRCYKIEHNDFMGFSKTRL